MYFNIKYNVIYYGNSIIDLIVNIFYIMYFNSRYKSRCHLGYKYNILLCIFRLRWAKSYMHSEGFIIFRMTILKLLSSNWFSDKQHNSWECSATASLIFHFILFDLKVVHCNTIKIKCYTTLVVSIFYT
jgi:hypothetical protein